MSGLDPVPRPPVEPSGAGRAVPEPKRPKWLVPVIAGGTAVVVLAAGGIGGYLYWNHNRLTEASGECATSYGKAVKARKKLTEYLESDALKAAISVKGSEVRDAETVAVLASTVKTAEQAKTDIPGCPVREPEGHPGGGRAARQGRGRVREDHGRGQGQGGCGQRLETRQDRCRRDQDPE